MIGSPSAYFSPYWSVIKWVYRLEVSSYSLATAIMEHSSLIYEVQWNLVNPVINVPERYKKMVDVVFVWARIKWL